MIKIMFSLFIFVTVVLLTNTANAQTSNTSLLKHTVVITFKQDAPADSIKALDDVYTALSKSPLVKSFEWGVNISPRDSGTIKHIYVTGFASQDDVKTYRKIPLYAKLFPISLSISDDVTVVDYWINK